jgi:16S rRNA G966 N2-methylase RsmD
MEDLFPHQDNVDYSRLRMTPEGLYSVTRRRDGQRMMHILGRAIPDMHSKTITDATACVGSDTLRFSQAFKWVHSIELKHDNVLVLQNNIQAFGASNVKVYEGDATKLFKWKTDVLYIDPPWGGPEYYTKHNLDIFLGKQRLDVWIESLLKEPEKDRPTYIVLKLPRNYNFTHLHFLPNVVETQFYKVRNFMLVLLQTKIV